MRESKFSNSEPEPSAPYLIERDVSWIQFNERVLAEAENLENPVLERLKFLGIALSNLDEFFMIRFASLARELASLRRGTQSNLKRLESHQALIDDILQRITELEQRASKDLEELKVELAKQSILLSPDLRDDVHARALAENLFNTEVLPSVSTLGKPTRTVLRTLQNLQLALIAPDLPVICAQRTAKAVFVDQTRDKRTYIFFLDQLLVEFGPSLWTESAEPSLIRLTRDSEVSKELAHEDPEAIPDIIRLRLRHRERKKPLRLQVRGNLSTEFIKNIGVAFGLSSNQMFRYQYPFSFGGIVGAIGSLSEAGQLPAALFYPAFRSCIPRPFESVGSIFNEILKRDYLFHHPYDSFDGYINFLTEAVADPQVVSIRKTIYRIDATSKAVDLLRKAAKKKEVQVFIEPRARFDEINNIELADYLRRGGVEVVFATGSLKAHAKLALVTRVAAGQIQHFTHLSTGNYNSKTARQYEDLGIFTANNEIGRDAETVLSAIEEGLIPDGFRHFIVAPAGLHRKMLALIQSEIAAANEGKPARIVAKVNSLVDRSIVNALYEASQAGVKIDLVVRGACCLIPGIKGLSENIRVISIVGRFLEHSRLYMFDSSNTLLLSSADLMPRNFFHRLEIAFPVLDGRIAEFLRRTVVPSYLDDNSQAWVLSRNCRWLSRKATYRGSPDARLSCQSYFRELAESDYRGTALEFEGTK